MKHLIALCLLTLVSAGFAQETFTVLFVKGDVTIEPAHTKVVRGAKLAATDKLKYATDEGMIAAISPSQGRVILKPQPDQKPQGGELAFVLKDIFMPVKSNAMTRGGTEELMFVNAYVIEAFFNQGTYAVLDSSSFLIDLEEFKLDQSNYFALEYTLSDGTSVKKKLPFAKNRVFFIADDLMTIEGNHLDPKQIELFELTYNQGEESISVANPNLVFPDLKTLRAELSLIRNSGVQNAQTEAVAYVNSIYGRCDESRLGYLFNALP